MEVYTVRRTKNDPWVALRRFSKADRFVRARCFHTCFFSSGYFSRDELLLWSGSMLLIAVSFAVFDRENYATLLASFTGVTSLIFNAKGNPAGQLLMVIFSLLYGWISFTFAYYGEMITYLGMTAPMAVLALISWMRHPAGEGRAEVEVNRLALGELVFAAMLTALVTVIFYDILAAFHTTNLCFSTLSVTTSFAAVYLTFRRSALYALAYAANDIVLIVLWTMAAFSDQSYTSVVICFVTFLLNDMYGFVSWSRMQKRQQELRQGKVQERVPTA